MFNWQDNPFADLVPGAQRGREYPSSIQGPPMQAPLQAPAQQDYTQAQTDQARAQTANLPRPDQAQALTQAQIGAAQAQALQAQQELAGANRDRRIQLMDTATALARAEQLYRQNVRGGLPGVVSNLNPLYSGNSEFDQAGDTLFNSALSLFRVPGTGSQSDRDAAYLERAGRPSSWSRDSRNEELFQGLRSRLENRFREYGLPVPDWDASAHMGELRSQLPEQADRSAPVAAVQPDEMQAANSSATRQVVDPIRRGHAHRLGMMLSQGASDQAVLDYARENLPATGDDNLQQLLRDRRNPRSNLSRWLRQTGGRQPVPVDPRTYTDQEDRGVVARTMGSAIEAMPEVSSYVTNAANSTVGGWLPDIANLTGLADGDDIRAGMEIQRAENPGMSLLGDVSGAIMAYGMGGNAARAGGVLQNAPRTRAIAGDALYGASMGASGNPDDRLRGAAYGSMLQAGGGEAGRRTIGAIGSTATGVRDQAVRRMTADRQPLSLGQTVGRSGPVGNVIQAAENASTSIPGIGSMVNRRHSEARIAYNRRAWDEALAPIGGNVGNRVGEEASEHARQAVSQAYTRALGGRTFTLDRPMDSALNTAAQRIGTLLPGFRADMDTIINQQIRPMLQQGDVQSALRAVKEGRAALAGTNGSGQAIRMLGSLEASLQRMVQRQHPNAYRELRAADRAHRLVSTAQAATQTAVNQEGVFTPAQLGSAARQNARTFGGRDLAASTRRPFYQSQRDAQRVLPNSIPDSGTAGRQMFGGALIGGAAGGAEWLGGDGSQVESAAPTLGVLGALALLNTRGGQRHLQQLLTARPDVARVLGQRTLMQNFNIPRTNLNYTTPGLFGVGVGTAVNDTYGLQNFYNQR